MKRDSVALAICTISALLGIGAIITRPFLLAPLGLIFLLVAAKLTANRRYTGTAAAILVLGALAGAAIAAGYSNPLY